MPVSIPFGRNCVFLYDISIIISLNCYLKHLSHTLLSIKDIRFDENVPYANFQVETWYTTFFDCQNVPLRDKWDILSTLQVRKLKLKSWEYLAYSQIKVGAEIETQGTPTLLFYLFFWRSGSYLSLLWFLFPNSNTFFIYGKYLLASFELFLIDSLFSIINLEPY